MLRGVRWYVTGVAALVALAGCGRGFVQYVQREAWREKAEVACMKSGTVREGPGLVRIAPIEGPGICGATYPLKVAVLGAGSAFGFAAEPMRPPSSIPLASQPRWPVAAPQASAMPPPLGQPRYVPSAEPRVLAPPPGAEPHAAPLGPPMSIVPPGIGAAAPAAPDEEERVRTQPAAVPPPALGPLRAPSATGSATVVEIKPNATLACPIVSALDNWVAAAVQPAAYKWFGQPVVEIRQISAYSCRGMNGQVGARISEHAFGNALDIAAFVLADGRRITVKRGWQGSAEEQAFLRDVQGAACDQFTTVLAPGSNRFHYDHIHVDLMRRGSGRRICNPGAIDGEVIAARVRRNPALLAGQRFEPPPTRRYDPPFDERNDPFAWRGDSARRGDPATTGSIGSRRGPPASRDEDNDWIEHDGPRPAVAD